MNGSTSYHKIKVKNRMDVLTPNRIQKGFGVEPRLILEINVVVLR